MPESQYKGRGKVLRYRRKNVKGGYLTLAVMSKKGKKGGRTIATLHRKTTRRKHIRRK